MFRRFHEIVQIKDKDMNGILENYQGHLEVLKRALGLGPPPEPEPEPEPEAGPSGMQSAPLTPSLANIPAHLGMELDELNEEEEARQEKDGLAKEGGQEKGEESMKVNRNPDLNADADSDHEVVMAGRADNEAAVVERAGDKADEHTGPSLS
ncbi:hypothetical protein EW146_g6497 [Bondarzewia mesenterica]|uniref:Uncharacterized protein n=1 Tax=Bondarzewia mesenterica TaxID=1095465 RepID=A0A4S4LU25_9AGAM|nr:hypothetical protein EW146_g6497 [Bondarzewia mesenterica]